MEIDKQYEEDWGAVGNQWTGRQVQDFIKEQLKAIINELNNIKNNYLPLTGGTLTGPLNFLHEDTGTLIKIGADTHPEFEDFPCFSITHASPDSWPLIINTDAYYFRIFDEVNGGGSIDVQNIQSNTVTASIMFSYGDVVWPRLTTQMRNDNIVYAFMNNKFEAISPAGYQVVVRDETLAATLEADGSFNVPIQSIESLEPKDTAQNENENVEPSNIDEQ